VLAAARGRPGGVSGSPRAPLSRAPGRLRAERRLIVATMLRSIPSLASGVVLLSLILYVYAIVGVSLFRHADPAHWGTLGRAALTLFEALTPQ